MTLNKSNEIKLTRIYDAPVKTVWEAWADPEQAAQWWGPRGFTLTTHKKDLRPGGIWRYTMHGPVGNDFPNTTRYLEVEKYSRLVYDHGGNENTPPLFRVTVQFTETHGQTKMEMSMKLPTPERAEETRKFIKKAGGDATWDRLAEYLAKQSSGKELFVINRSFDTPLDRMFKMWTEPAHFSKWLAPTGFQMEFIKSDIKPGGSTFYSMTDGKTKMYGQAHYLKIERPHRIVYTQQFCDEKGNISRHPFAPTWPETMQTQVAFTEEGPNQTRVTVVWEVVGKATREEMETFIKGRAGMTQGWTGSFDKLENYLSNREEIMTQPIPKGYHSVTPSFTFKDSKKAIEFYKKAFGAKVLDLFPNLTGQGIMHATIQIGDSVLMMGDEMQGQGSENCSKSAETIGKSPITLFLYVPDSEATFKQAVAAGGTTIMPVMDMFWGDRCGTMKDPFGYTWMIATHKQDLTQEEIRKGAESFFAQMAKK